MRRVLVGATLVLVAGMTTGCGGTPDDASKEDFCEAWNFSRDPADTQKAFEKRVEELEEVGTPEGISKDAREGFEIAIDVFAEVDDIKDEDSLDGLEKDLDKDDQKKVEKFFEYIGKTCAPAPE